MYILPTVPYFGRISLENAAATPSTSNREKMGQVAHAFDPGERFLGIWGTGSVILTLTALHSGVAVWQTRVLFAPLAVRLPLESPRGLWGFVQQIQSEKNQAIDIKTSPSFSIFP